MGLIGALHRAGVSRAHVLVAEAPGAFRQRVALERAVGRMGWMSALSVADADVLAVVGEPGPALAAVFEHTWAQMSAPRARVHLRTDTDVEARLAEAREELLGREPDLRDGFTPSAEAAVQAEAHDEDHDAHHDHGSDAAHDHSAMMPDGIPLAEGGEDRDGLEMDELHLPLGPVLAHWPAGLVLRVTLHGDVVVAAEVERLAAAREMGSQSDDASTRAARLLDAAASVLVLAGVPGEAARVRGLRDRCLDGVRVDAREVAELGDRVGRLRVLRWVLRGLAVESGTGGSVRLHDRLLGLFEQAAGELGGDGPRRGTLGVQALPDLVRGLELATVRLWLAAITPDLVEAGLSEVGDG